jgi:hypothetical protein
MIGSLHEAVALTTIFMGLTTHTAAPDTSADALWDALRSPGPSPDVARRTSLYDRVIGDWDVDIVDYDPVAPPRASRGEWYFRWVLEGRAIQDVFIAPVRSERRTPIAHRDRYGTTIRVYDAKSDTWHITWINPASGAFNTLVGRPLGHDIVQEGRDTDGTLMRWSFSEITATSFVWRGEESRDDGKTWRLVAEFHARRKPRAR